MSLYQTQINLIYLSMIVIEFKVNCRIFYKLKALNNNKIRLENSQILIKIRCQKTRNKIFNNDKIRQINSNNRLIKIIIKTKVT